MQVVRDKSYGGYVIFTGLWAKIPKPLSLANVCIKWQ